MPYDVAKETWFTSDPPTEMTAVKRGMKQHATIGRMKERERANELGSD